MWSGFRFCRVRHAKPTQNGYGEGDGDVQVIGLFAGAPWRRIGEKGVDGRGDFSILLVLTPWLEGAGCAGKYIFGRICV